MNPLARLRQVAMVGSIESLGVIAGGIAGLLIVNVLPKDQYAAYTFLVACMTLMLGVTDLGLAHCCLPVVGQRNLDVPWVVGACQQVFSKRWLLLIAGLIIVVPYWFMSSREHGWFGVGYIVASLLMLAVVLMTLREHYMTTVLMILGHISTLNRVGAIGTVIRIAIIGLVLVLPLGAWWVVGVVAATTIVEALNVMLFRNEFKKREIAEARLGPEDARKVDAQIVKIAAPLVLPAIFYQVQGVITVFLVSLFGTSNMVAEVGAFGRLSMVLIVVDRVTNVLLFPAIARAPEGPRLRTILWKAHTAYLGMMALALLTAFFLPQYWILLLGEKYRNMQPLVWMVFMSSILGNAAGFAFRSLTVRGATSGQGYSILATIVAQVLYLALVGVSDLKSILGFGIATSFAGFAYQYGMLALRWRGWAQEPAPAPAPVVPAAGEQPDQARL